MKKTIDSLLSHTGDVALRRRAKWILEKIKSKNPKSILDVGCGDGFYLYLLCELFPKPKIVGIDKDKNALKSAAINLKDKNLKIKHGDIYNLNFSDNSFDIILASEILEHLKDDFKGLKEIYRVLRPGGLVLISVPHGNYPLLWDPINWFFERIFKTHIKKGFFAGIWNQHERLYSQDQLTKVVKKVGFKGIKSDILTHICLPFNHYLLNIFARILAGGPSFRKTSLNKFSGNKNKSLTPFWLLFYFDKLNDIFKSKWVGVSLVLSAIK